MKNSARDVRFPSDPSAEPAVAFHCTTVTGEPIDLNLTGIPVTGRISKGGRRVICFPKPFAFLEIVDGERLGIGKVERIKAAIEHFRQGAREQEIEAAATTIK